MRCVRVACTGGTSRQSQQTVVHSLWWESLPEPREAGAGMWGRWLPRPHMPLNNDALLLWCPRFFHRLSRLWSSLLLSLQAVFSKPTAVPSLGPRSKPHFPAPSPPLQQVTHDSGWNVQRCGVDHVCSSYFVLPSTVCLSCSPLIPRRSFSVLAAFTTVREFF